MEHLHNALIGYTGFVGGNILSQHSFDYLYNSKNIENIRGKEFELVVSAGVSGLKRLANQEPENDMAAIKKLMENLETIKTKKMVLISTVDVYPSPENVDEDTDIQKEALASYGKNRFMLEEFVQNNFDSLTVRLPALFGLGLKKNSVFDLMQGPDIFINKASQLQFYPLSHIWSDITVALAHNIKLINFVVEPISVAEIGKEVFYFDQLNDKSEALTNYDVHTKYADFWRSNKQYLYTKNQVLNDLKSFIYQN